MPEHTLSFPTAWQKKAFISKLYFLGAWLQISCRGEQGLLGNLHGVDTPIGSALIIPFRCDPGTRVMDENTVAFWSNNKIRHEVWWHRSLARSLALSVSLSVRRGRTRGRSPLRVVSPRGANSRDGAEPFTPAPADEPLSYQYVHNNIIQVWDFYPHLSRESKKVSSPLCLSLSFLRWKSHLKLVLSPAELNYLPRPILPSLQGEIMF